MKPLVTVALVIGATCLYNLAWDYVPLFPALVTIGLLIGLPLALIAAVIKNKKD